MSETFDQAVIWTALPQGFVPGTEQEQARVSVFVTPQLSASPGGGAPPHLSTYTDWVNWPQTMQGSPLKLKLNISLATDDLKRGGAVSVVAEPDLTVLKPDLWTAMFPADKTRVEPYAIENFNSIPIKSYHAAAVHNYVESLYGPLNAGTATPLTFESEEGGAESDARGMARPDLYLKGGEPGFPMPIEKVGLQSSVYTNLVARPAEFYDVLKFHEVPKDERAAPPTEAPIIDFHSAVSSLSAYPELLRYFGLVFTLTLDTIPRNANAALPYFLLSVEPEWKSSFDSNSINVTPRTVGVLDTFLAKPYGADYNNESSDVGAGFLLLDKTYDGATPQFSVLDIDVDGAAESVNSTVAGLEGTLETHSESSVSIDLRLPSLKSAGPSILWHGWGEESRSIEQGSSLNLAALAAMQTKFQEEVKAFIEKLDPEGPLVYSEHITRGWRIDVGAFLEIEQEGRSNISWNSLHWRNGFYTFGTGDSQQSLEAPEPIEGFVSPGVTHQPVAKGETPGQLWIHESIARWDGWSLSAPRPGKHILNSGTASKEGEEQNPVPEVTHEDEYGNINPQISANFSIPKAGTAVINPETVGSREEEKVGETGLPPLRFGRLYFYRARSVDLSGWSVPQLTEEARRNGPELLEATHYRWEPVRSPFVVPTAPLGVGEGTLTIVIRDDGTGPVEPNARWLFPPKVHELLAEEHGAFDEDGVPRVDAQTIISQYNDGSLATIPGMKVDAGSAGVENLVLPHSLKAPSSPVPVTWLPDPPAAGVAISGTGAPRRALAKGYESLPGGTPPFVDLWAGEWPALIAKLLVVQAAKPPYVGYDSVDKKDVTDHWPWLAEPLWSFSEDEPESARQLTMTVVPGSVYQLQISSAFAAPAEPAELGELGSFGLWPWIEKAIQKPIFEAGPPLPPLNPIEARSRAQAGLQYQLTPAQTLTVVYAVLIPQRPPAFSAERSSSREPNSTAVTIEDPHYLVDPPSTSTVTYEATWTDPVDNPSEPEDWIANPSEPEDNGKVPRAFAQEPRTSSQSGLLVHVENLYPPVVPAGQVTVSPPEGEESPFGFIGFEGGFDELGPKFYAEQRIGDTKHHLVTYTATAASRFGEFFATTTTVTLGTAPTEIDSRGISPTNLKVVVPEAKSSKGVALPAVTVPASLYEVDAPGGTITLKSGASVKQAPAGKPPADGETVELEKTEVAVTYVPKDTLLGPPQERHVLSSATPPPVKIVKVAPAWSITRQGDVDLYGGYRYQREGNTLRVYFERPWYATGADELLGVVVARDAPGPSLPSQIRADLVTTLGLDPISVPSHDGEVVSQSQLIFVTNAKVPATETTPEQDKATVTLLEETGDNLYDVWPYKPQYDPESGLWFVDVKLANFEQEGVPSPPPGYFLRLSLVRYQPFSEFSQVSPVALVTYAQPVPDRTVEVLGEEPCRVTVRGPAYYGWRPPAGQVDRENPDAEHPNGVGGGSMATSTMVVEVQEQNDENGFSGDLAWSTVAGYVSSLTPNFGENEVEWTNPNGIKLPSTSKPLRLRISELDYYGDGPLPAQIDTSQRRTFVCLIPFPS
jgi:hypothetical protein